MQTTSTKALIEIYNELADTSEKLKEIIYRKKNTTRYEIGNFVDAMTVISQTDSIERTAEALDEVMKLLEINIEHNESITEYTDD